MTNNSERIVMFVLYFSLLIAFGFLVTDNPDNQVKMIILTTFFTLIQVFRISILPRIKFKIKTPIEVLLITIQFVFAFFIQMIDGYFVPQIYFFILLSEVAYSYRLVISIPFTFMNYLAFVFGVYINHNYPPFADISFVIPRMLEYWLIFGFSYMAKRSNEQSKQLEIAFQQLEIANAELAEKTLIEERIRLSRELHDTIGHSLTTTIVGLEVSKQLHEKGLTQKAIERIPTIQDQIKKSLQDIRLSSRTLHDNPLRLSFKQQVENLLNNTAQQSDIIITHDISDIQNLSPNQEITLYRALQEGLTNGIKHGKATQFSFSLKESGDHIQFHLQDNGNAGQGFEFGFGLTSMHERICAIGGTLELNLTQTKGCSLIILIPIIHKGKTYESTEESAI
ncbi:sensor histidine kinase [Ferdinandcohnia quinoae]|uniref:histidine kinase n=1 Tax=Fredinandcohnia quinoae TaxID=2918902 RepID=A0AAW5E634_9BACI|nr:sensor histidine kinase [Fredinandcohnia sp. SECRCQ15]MCH1624588.1 sensor histidine kinase [Fredinandcohnia sp. SECRCQ15]